MVFVSMGKFISLSFPIPFFAKEEEKKMEKKITNENIITIPVEKIDMTILMSIWYKQLQPLLFSERVIDGKRCIDFMKEEG